MQREKILNYCGGLDSCIRWRLDIYFAGICHRKNSDGLVNLIVLKTSFSPVYATETNFL